MSKLTINKQEESSNTQENAENNHNKNSSLHEQIKIEGTPFTLIRHVFEDDSVIWFIVMGNYKITEPTETKEEQLEKLETEKWLIIMHMIIICIKKQMENPVVTEM